MGSLATIPSDHRPTRVASASAAGEMGAFVTAAELADWQVAAPMRNASTDASATSRGPAGKTRGVLMNRLHSQLTVVYEELLGGRRRSNRLIDAVLAMELLFRNCSLSVCEADRVLNYIMAEARRMVSVHLEAQKTQSIFLN